MPRILFVNPNSSQACSDGIAAAVAPFARYGPRLEVVTLTEGPPAIYSWRDWHQVVEPLCRLSAREPARVLVIACASDPGIEAVRATVGHPVLGVFRCAAAAAVARAERFGVIALVVIVVMLLSLRRGGGMVSMIAVGLVVGGAIGNIADRLFRGRAWLHGSVIDFIDFRWWPIFNVADMGVTIGGALLVLSALLQSRKVSR